MPGTIGELKRMRREGRREKERRTEGRKGEGRNGWRREQKGMMRGGRERRVRGENRWKNKVGGKHKRVFYG